MNEEYKMEENQLLDSELAEVTGGINMERLNGIGFRGRRKGDYVLFLTRHDVLLMGKITNIKTILETVYYMRVLAQSCPLEVQNHIGTTVGPIDERDIEYSRNYAANYGISELYGAQGQMINIPIY